MIRDSDGKNPETLVKQLCKYYDDRALEDVNSLPRIQPRNILILKYYSFENYFLNPAVMTEIGVIGYEEEFYNILFEKYKSYLFKLASAKNMKQVTGLNIRTKDDLKKNIETFKIYMRGHNLFDIFYGRYKGEKQNEILTKYIDVAPRSDFADILNAIDNFIYFMNRRIEDKELKEEPQEYTYSKHKKKKKYNRNGNSGNYNQSGNYQGNNKHYDHDRRDDHGDRNNRKDRYNGAKNDTQAGEHGYVGEPEYYGHRSKKKKKDYSYSHDYKNAAHSNKQHSTQYSPKTGAHQTFTGKKKRRNFPSDYGDYGYSDLNDSVLDD
jgi:hypothetical protein